MLGGHSAVSGAAFARLAAKVPARRVATAVERLLDLYRREREHDESPESYFARVPVPHVKALLADLEAMSADTITTEDYIDLGETKTFVPEVTEGECAT
jgi:hypothetical protein